MVLINICSGRSPSSAARWTSPPSSATHRRSRSSRCRSPSECTSPSPSAVPTGCRSGSQSARSASAYTSGSSSPGSLLPSCRGCPPSSGSCSSTSASSSEGPTESARSPSKTGSSSAAAPHSSCSSRKTSLTPSSPPACHSTSVSSSKADPSRMPGSPAPSKIPHDIPFQMCSSAAWTSRRTSSHNPILSSLTYRKSPSFTSLSHGCYLVFYRLIDSFIQVIIKLFFFHHNFYQLVKFRYRNITRYLHNGKNLRFTNQSILNIC